MTTRHNDSNLPKDMEQLINELALEHVYLYHLYAKAKSFQAVGALVNRSPNTVRDRMQSASALFDRVFKRPLMEQAHGKYELTDHGQYFADVFPDLTEWVEGLIARHRTARHVYDVPCTSNGLTTLAELRKALPQPREFDLRPRPVRTADLQVYEDQRMGSPFAFGSILVSTAQCFEDGDLDAPPRRIVNVLDSVDVVTLRNEPLLLLAPRSLQLEEPVDVGKLLNADVSILIPRGGVVWRFMQHNAELWHERRPRQFVEIPHLDYGLEMLKLELIPNGVMIVHGEADELERKVPTCRTLKFVERNGMHHRALTGLILDHTAHLENQDHFDVVKEHAEALFCPQTETYRDAKGNG
jgi:hypothetical protein